MKIALLGYGKMGKQIEKIALSRNHAVPIKIDIDNQDEKTADNLKTADVAIDFSTPDSAYDNIQTCFEANLPVVCGTTGWLDKKQEIEKLVYEKNQSFFWSSNFSLGVNIFFMVNEYLAKIMNQNPAYDLSIEETHHTTKVDAPSGTAITLAEKILTQLDRKNAWELDGAGKNTINITALRKDDVPGIHKVTYDSEVDYIEFVHSAKSRKGFALGAVLAAEFIKDKKGVFSMNDILKLE